VLAYTCWGLFPLYWRPLQQVPALEILAHRIAWSLVFLGCLLIIKRHGRWLLEALRQPALLARFTLSATLLSLNWFLYIWAVNSAHVVEASLGYFITPLVSVLLGRVALKERLRPAQRLAVALATAGVIWLTLSAGAAPWIALGLASSFGLYGLMRKLAPLGSLEGLTLETLALAFPAGGFLLWLELTNAGHFGHVPLSMDLLLAGAGIVTAVPLLLFASAARLLPLSTMGVLQFISPTLQFLLGAIFFGEPLHLGRLWGFALIWAAVALFARDGLASTRR
jgi:chloramphenicol-sensitive protein RarD